MESKLLDARQEAKLKMYGVVTVRCDDNGDIIAGNLGFKTALEEFGTIVLDIGSHAQLAGAVITGIAVDKGASANTLCALAAKIAGLIYAYAAKTGNNTLKAAVNFSKSDLRALKDAELAPACRNVHGAGVANLAALKDYGVTAAKLAELQTAIDAYAAMVAGPRDAIVGRSVTKANIRDKFTKADFILRELLDKLIEGFAGDHPDFVAQYKSARKIVDPKSKAKENGEGDENAKGGDGDDGNGGANNPPTP
jgi:hypothetical protein